MGKRARSGRDAGALAALEMLRRLETESTLADACDPGYDRASAMRPMIRNIVLECLEPHRDDSAAVEGFCLALSGFLGEVSSGGVPTARILGRDLRRHLAHQARHNNARSDGPFQQFLGQVAAA